MWPYEYMNVSGIEIVLGTFIGSVEVVSLATMASEGNANVQSGSKEVKRERFDQGDIENTVASNLLEMTRVATEFQVGFDNARKEFQEKSQGSLSRSR